LKREGISKSLFFRTSSVDNSLSGSLPSELSRLSMLESLSLGSNRLYGRIPSSIFSLQHLYSLTLSNNQLTGEIPEEMSQALQILNLSYNSQLGGTIPSGLVQLPDLVHLALFDTNLEGTVPDFSNQQNLVFVALGRSRLSGTIASSLTMLPNLKYLYLIENRFSGPLPTDYHTEAGNKLRQVYVSGNQLTGSIPAELKDLSNLQHLGLDFNLLTGSLPPELSSLVALKRLYLNNNENLVGEIQVADLETLFSTLKELQIQSTGLISRDNSLCNLRGTDNAWTFLASDCILPSDRVVCTCCNVCCPDSTTNDESFCRSFAPSGGDILESTI
jgi:Leucine-rich repeat (LRR) protein